MLKSKTVYNYYFSGTGNTETLVKHFSAKLNKLGITSHIRKIEENSFPDTEENWALGLMFSRLQYSQPSPLSGILL